MLRRLFRSLLAGHGTVDAVMPAHSNLPPDSYLVDGVTLHKAGAFAKAESAYAKALELDPGNADALHLLGMLALRRGDLDRAEDLVREALRALPVTPIYLNTLASVLSNMGRHEEAYDLLMEALNLEPGAIRVRANLLFLLNIIPDVSRERMIAEHIDWGNRHASFGMATENSWLSKGKLATSRGSERIRIGYVSGDFCSHPVGRIISGVLRCHDRKSVEVFCYDNGSDNDEIKTMLQKRAEHWVDVESMNDDDLAAQIRSDGIQVLVDLSGHTRKHRLQLFGQKPAPVQATWLGYLNTTGVKRIDWRITDTRADPPPQSQQWHVERLWYLPDCPWVWEPLPNCSPDVSEMPCNRHGYITYGSFNTFRKINDVVIAAWAKLLCEVPNARLRVYGAPGGRAVDRVYDLFEFHGVSSSRVDLFASVEYQRYLLAYGDVDISLDPFPYNGGATTCESLWMGVPVVTLAGSGGFARSGASIAGAVGLPELVAESVHDYIDIAIRLARDRERLAILRKSLRQKVLSSPLADVTGFTRNLENAYRGMWQQWQEAQFTYQSDPDQAEHA
jgi:predicted O-linked N-acetylglucosamine transferase (SPINDLY family)